MFICALVMMSMGVSRLNLDDVQMCGNDGVDAVSTIKCKWLSFLRVCVCLKTISIILEEL